MSTAGPSTTIRIRPETWARLQEHATSFASSALGTPDKVITALLDEVDGTREPERTRKPHVRVDQHEILAALAETGGGDLETIADHFGISTASARRKLDGLVAQGKLTNVGSFWTAA